MTRYLNNQQLIQELYKNGVIKLKNVRDVLIATDRKFYAPTVLNAHMDSPQYLGYGATISAPHMHAYALEIMNDYIIGDQKRILDVGSGSGYLLAALRRMNPSAEIIGIEHIPELVNLSLRNLSKDNKMDKKVKVILGDARKPNPNIIGQFDCIHVGAAAPTLPKFLLNILKVGGSMIIPVGDQEKGFQSYQKINKISENTHEVIDLMCVMYVPLTSKEDQLSRYVD